MELKKSNKMFYVQKNNSKLIFEFLSIFSPFQTKSGKTCIFCDFLKNCEFLVKVWHYLCVPCEIPFLKMYTFMYFHEFVKKLCYKLKMPKRDV